MEKVEYKKLIGVSGGVDSMFLLNKMKDENIIVAYVNYNIREDVNIDFKIVSNFCKLNNLTLEILSLNEKYVGNFQEWAREKRYNFFKTIYDKYKCNELIIAHHKDDFLETAIMQWSSKRNPTSFGICKNSNIFGMNVVRPMLFQYWKSEIYDMCHELQIPFHDDYTNFTNQYTRNKLRSDLDKKSLLIKDMMFKSFQKINAQKSIINIEIIKKYIEWEETSFNIDFLALNDKYYNDLIFKFLIENLDEVKISSNILKGIKSFLFVHNGNKTFMLSSGKKISKFNNNVIIK